jgi:hypothetical protein
LEPERAARDSGRVAAIAGRRTFQMVELGLSDAGKSNIVALGFWKWIISGPVFSFLYAATLFLPENA